MKPQTFKGDSFCNGNSKLLYTYMISKKNIFLLHSTLYINDQQNNRISITLYKTRKFWAILHIHDSLNFSKWSTKNNSSLYFSPWCFDCGATKKDPWSIVSKRGLLLQQSTPVGCLRVCILLIHSHSIGKLWLYQKKYFNRGIVVIVWKMKGYRGNCLKPEGVLW